MKSRTSLWKKLVFALTAIVVVVGALESAARLAERYRPPVPVDARSLQLAQQLDFPKQPVERARVSGREVKVKWCGELAWYGTQGQSFPAVKDKNEYRIVLLGGSAPAGYGMASTGTFIKKAERFLNRNDADRRFRTFNLARTAWNSAQMVEMARTCAPEIEPDLIVTVMGNNEYLDLVSFGRSTPEMHRAILARRLEQHSALARFLRFTPHLDPANPPPSWPSFPRTPEIMDYVTGRLKRSIHHLAAFARARHAKLLVCTVPVNYRYQSLREWFFTDNLGPPYPPEFVKARWGMYYEDYETAAAEMEKRLAKLPDDPAAHLIAALAYRKLGRQTAAEEHFARTIALLTKRDQQPGPVLFNNTAMRLIATCELYGKEACVKEIEPLLPGMAQTASNDARGASMFHYQRGFLLSLLGRDAEAKEEFRVAINSLLLPANRADDWINRTLVEAAREEGDVEVFDLAAALADISPAKIPGYDYFFDYCHYTALGHTAVGALLARRIADLAGVATHTPGALDAVTEERALRRKRPTDLPDIDHWVGADYRPECLVSELVCWPEFENPLNDLARHLIGGEAALTRVFMGNWYAASPSRDITGERARQYYEQALSHDPRLAAARANLEWLKLYR